MQHSYRTKGWAKRLGAMAMTLVMLFGLMAAGLPQAQAVTQDDINNLKSQAASLSSQKADIQKKLDKLSNSKNSALNEKLLLEELKAWDDAGSLSLSRNKVTVSGGPDALTAAIQPVDMLFSFSSFTVGGSRSSSSGAGRIGGRGGIPAQTRSRFGGGARRGTR